MKIIYNIKRLIEKQPKKLKSDNDYKNLYNYVIKDKTFLNLSLKRKTYFDIDKCRIKISSLNNYIKHNKLNNQLFFITFYKIKLKYLEMKTKKKELLNKNINLTLKKLDKHTINYLKLFYNYEKKLSGNKPIITYKFFPKTLNKTKLFINNDYFFYYCFFNSIKKHLLKKYITFDVGFMEFYMSKYIFEFDINEKIDKSNITDRFRTLSKKIHPDCGGDENNFKILNECRKILIDNFLKII